MSEGKRDGSTIRDCP